MISVIIHKKITCDNNFKGSETKRPFRIFKILVKIISVKIYSNSFFSPFETDLYPFYFFTCLEKMICMFQITYISFLENKKVF